MVNFCFLFLVFCVIVCNCIICVRVCRLFIVRHNFFFFFKHNNNKTTFVFFTCSVLIVQSAIYWRFFSWFVVHFHLLPGRNFKFFFFFVILSVLFLSISINSINLIISNRLLSSSLCKKWYYQPQHHNKKKIKRTDNISINIYRGVTKMFVCVYLFLFLCF